MYIYFSDVICVLSVIYQYIYYVPGNREVNFCYTALVPKTPSYLPRAGSDCQQPSGRLPPMRRIWLSTAVRAIASHAPDLTVNSYQGDCLPCAVSDCQQRSGRLPPTRRIWLSTAVRAIASHAPYLTDNSRQGDWPPRAHAREYRS